MKPTQQLHDLGQSLWLDNITRGLLTDGTLRRYISEFSVTGLTSNPTIFDKAIKEAGFYDAAIRQKTAEGKSGEGLFFDLALEDLIQAAGLFCPAHDRTGGVDGCVSLEVSPLLANDTAGTINAVAQLHLAFADQGELTGVLPVDGGNPEEVLAEFTQRGIDDAAIAAQLHCEGTESFDKSWQDLMGRLASKSATLATVDQTNAGQR